MDALLVSKPHITPIRIKHLGRCWMVRKGENELGPCLSPSRGLQDFLRIERGRIAGTNRVEGGMLWTAEPATYIS
jgi:hypothetical protein